jgi:hypothetical protein
MKPAQIADKGSAERALARELRALGLPLVPNAANRAEFAMMAEDSIEDTLGGVVRTSPNFMTPKKVNLRGKVPAAVFWPPSFPVSLNVCSRDILADITFDKKWSGLAEEYDLAHLIAFEYRPRRPSKPRRKGVLSPKKFEQTEANFARFTVVRIPKGPTVKARRTAKRVVITNV